MPESFSYKPLSNQELYNKVTQDAADMKQKIEQDYKELDQRFSQNDAAVREGLQAAQNPYAASIFPQSGQVKPLDLTAVFQGNEALRQQGLALLETIGTKTQEYEQPNIIPGASFKEYAQHAVEFAKKEFSKRNPSATEEEKQALDAELAKVVEEFSTFNNDTVVPALKNIGEAANLKGLKHFLDNSECLKGNLGLYKKIKDKIYPMNSDSGTDIIAQTSEMIGVQPKEYALIACADVLRMNIKASVKAVADKRKSELAPKKDGNAQK